MNMIGPLDRPTGGSYCIRGTRSQSLVGSDLADLRPTNGEFASSSNNFNLLPAFSARRQCELPFSTRRTPRRPGAADAKKRLGPWLG